MVERRPGTALQSPDLQVGSQPSRKQVPEEAGGLVTQMMRRTLVTSAEGRNGSPYQGIGPRTPLFKCLHYAPTQPKNSIPPGSARMALNEGNEGIFLLVPFQASGLQRMICFPVKHTGSFAKRNVERPGVRDGWLGRLAQASVGVAQAPACVLGPGRQHFPELACSEPLPPRQSCASGCFAVHTAPAAGMSHHATRTLTGSTLHLKYPRVAGQNPAVCDL